MVLIVGNWEKGCFFSEIETSLQWFNNVVQRRHADEVSKEIFHASKLVLMNGPYAETHRRLILIVDSPCSKLGHSSYNFFRQKKSSAELFNCC